MEERVVEIGLPNGSTVLAQVAAVEGEEGPYEAPAEGVEGPGATKASAVKMPSFGEVSDQIQGIAESVRNALHDVSPDRVGLEFGLALKLKSGGLTSLLVAGEGEASLLVTLEWDKDE